MDIKTFQDIDAETLEGKKILVRVDYNCPIEDGKVADETRILATFPTLQFLLDSGAKPILISHLGRPKGIRIPELSLNTVANRLRKLARNFLNAETIFAEDCIGEEALEGISQLDKKKRALLLLENLRFYKKETENDPQFAKELASFASIFVQDAFGTVHRSHASTDLVAKELPAYAGLLVEKEIKILGELLKNPKRPFVAIIGGAKVSTKIKILENLIKKVNTILIGGAMAYTFLKARDIPIGASLVENHFQAEAFTIMSRAQDNNTEFLLPVDHLVTSEVSDNGKIKVVSHSGIPEDWYGVDIGPKTISLFANIIKKAGTVFWNGPIGIFEIEKFSKGSKTIAMAMAKTKAKTIAGGGDVISALHKFNCADNINHISTGGGASLEFLSGMKLPGIIPLIKD